MHSRASSEASDDVFEDAVEYQQEEEEDGEELYEDASDSETTSAYETASERASVSEHSISIDDAQSTRTNTASSVESVPVPKNTKPAVASYLKASSYLMGSLGTLVSAVGWILIRQVPLMQPVGQALASALKNGFGSADEYYKENQPKAVGQGISATGQLVGIAGVSAVNATGNTSLTGVRAAAAALNGTGMVFTGVGERRKKDMWKAGSNFVGAALNLAGTVGYAVEAARSNSVAFLVLGGINTFNNTATPLGGAVDDNRKSKVKQAWLRDPKVVGQEISDLGFALNAIASTLNKLYSTKDKEAGTHDSQHYAQLISALGATGMFLATVGYVVSTYAEFPKRPAPASNDIEMGTRVAEGEPGDGGPSAV